MLQRTQKVRAKDIETIVSSLHYFPKGQSWTHYKLYNIMYCIGGFFVGKT